MIRPEDIYAATNRGLDIILDYYPQAAECVDNKKHFKRRLSEDDASACLKLFKTPDGGEIYKVTDFGDQGHAMSPVDIVMHEDGIRFPEAILKLATRYGVTDTLDRNVNKPEIRQRPAKVKEKDGSRFFELEEGFTPDQLRILGPRVKKEDVEFLNWHVVKSISYVKNREVTTKSTTPNYPIFIRECLVKASSGESPEVKFYKIYEPLNLSKQYRFSYTPEGVKPKQYINGFEELKALFRKMNADEEAIFKQDPANDAKAYKEKKLPEAFICSGERDALCVKSLGYPPLWFNSETYKVDPEEIKQIYRYVEVLYNIPDIDTTGIVKGTELALKYMDVRTIWLPRWLNTYHDHRGKPRKDFRDFVEIRPGNDDFRSLMVLANPAKFWVKKFVEKTNSWSYEIDSDSLDYFLKLNGFYSLKDDSSSQTKFIRIVGNTVSLIKARDIRRFIRTFATERALAKDVRNLIRNSNRMSDSALENLEEIDLDFTNYTHNSQYFFFPKSVWEVTADQVTEYRAGSINTRHVWEENVIPHNCKLLPDMFSITRKEDVEGNFLFDIDIPDISSNKSCSLRAAINSSRLHWRKTMEYGLQDMGSDEAERYKIQHKFDIAEEGLSQEEIKEQKDCLIAKIFAIGFMMHRYKSPSKAWAVMAMDNKIGEDGECNGRSGKSFFFFAVSNFMKTVKLSGRNPKLMDNQHVFERVSLHTDFMYVDDCNKYLSLDMFYDLITSGMTVNPKNNQSFDIPFQQSPKIGFTTNYVPSDFDPSTEARLLYMIFSDWYHQRTQDNDYLETRSIRDDFGKDLFTDYNEEEWEWDINFFIQCAKAYLNIVRLNVKLQPPMGNIMKRKYKQDMGVNFEDWAYSYFSEEGEHVNCFVPREEALGAYKLHSNVKNVTMQRFTKALKGFCKLCPYVDSLDPEEYRNSQGRIIRKNSSQESKEMIYIRTIERKEEEAVERQGTLFEPSRINDESAF